MKAKVFKHVSRLFLFVLSCSLVVAAVICIDVSDIKASQNKKEGLIPVVEGNSVDWTNEFIELYVESQDGDDRYSFSDDKEQYAWQTSNVSKKYGENQIVYVAKQDKHGNISPIKEVRIDKMDALPPVIDHVSVDKHQLLNGQLTFTISASDTLSGITDYSFDDGKTWQSEPTFTLTQDAIIAIQVKDRAGNITKHNTTYTYQTDQGLPLLLTQSQIRVKNNEFIEATLETADSIHLDTFSFDGGQTWQSKNTKQLQPNVNEIEVMASLSNDKARSQSKTVSMKAQTIAYMMISGPSIIEENGRVRIISAGLFFDSAVIGEKEDGVYTIDGLTYYTYYSFDMETWHPYTGPFTLKPSEYGTIYARLLGVYSGFISRETIKNTGHTYQTKQVLFDMPIGKETVEFVNSYDSADGIWHSTYASSYIKHSIEEFQEIDAMYPYVDDVNNVLIMRMPDGQRSYFVATNSVSDTGNASVEYKNINGDKLTIINNERAYIKLGNLTYMYLDQKLAAIQDPYGNTITITNDNEYTIRNNSGITYHVDYQGREDIITDPLGNTKTFHRDGSITFHDISLVNQDITTNGIGTIEYDTLQRPIKITKKNGSWTTYSYAVYDDRAYCVTEVDSLGHQINLYYDLHYNLMQQNDEQGNSSYYYYDEKGRITTSGENDIVKKYTYNDHGYLTKIMSEQSTLEEYTYNDSNRIIRSKNSDDIYMYYTYNTQNDMLIEAELKDPSGTIPASYIEANHALFYVTRYKYNSDGSLSQRVSEKENTREEYTYHANGYLKKTVITNLEDATDTMYVDTVYDDNGRLLSETTPEHTNVNQYDQMGNLILQNNDGKITRTLYDVSGNIKQQIEYDQYDATKDGLMNANASNTYADANVGHRYVYDTSGNVIKEINAQQKETYYEYTQTGDLTKTSFDIYQFQHTIMGNIKNVKLGTETLLTNTYSNDTKELLQETVYANAQKRTYQYNKKNKVSAISYDQDTTPRFTYTYDGQGTMSQMNDKVNNMKTIYEKDGATSYRLNDEDRIYHAFHEDDQQFKETAMNQQYTRLNDEDGLQVFYTNETAKLGLDVKRNVENKYAKTTISKMDGDVKTSLITEAYTYDKDLITNKDVELKNRTYNMWYTYDEHNNITHETSSGLDIYHYYDDKQHLIRSDDMMGRTTNIYKYDDRGNILSSKKYDTREYEREGEAASSSGDDFSYGNNAWKDQLTAFNGKRIEYDEMGNRTNFDGWTYTWEAGRQLKNMKKTGKNISYQYDDRGIRTEKTVNGTTTSYTTIDGRITSQDDGVNKLYFRYDEEGNVITFEWNGVEYVYIKNIQGDVIGIADMNGNQIVEYTYDDWGTPGWMSGDEALANINPMRYRGYYYDNETGYYYLQSRYYEPSMKRFINADDSKMLLHTKDQKQGLNLYSYCANNPILTCDYNGLFTISVNWGRSPIAFY